MTGRKLHYMAKDSLYRRPARILLSVGAFPVHRESADREALRRAQRVLDAGEVLVLFPEGERRTGPGVEDLHEGAAFLAGRTGAPIIPVGIGGTVSVMPKGTKVPGRPGPPGGRRSDPAAGTHAAGRVSRSQVHGTTEALQASLAELYARALASTGRP